MLIHVVRGVRPDKMIPLYFISSYENVPFLVVFRNVRVVCKTGIRNVWTVLVFCSTGVSPIVSEHRKQIDDLKKFKNDFRVSFSVC